MAVREKGGERKRRGGRKREGGERERGGGKVKWSRGTDIFFFFFRGGR